MSETTKRALVLLAPGAEEMETTIAVDVLRRGGVEVLLAGVDGVAAVSCSRGVRLLPDVSLDTAPTDVDAIVLPGGAEGAERLAQSELVGERLREHWQAGGLVAAVCAGPIALMAHGIALGQTITNHPSVSPRLRESYTLSTDPVVSGEQLITSQGPGTSFVFALAILERLCGAETAKRVRQPMMLLPA